MAKHDRILSQSEIDSLLKKIMPSTDEPVSSEKQEPTRLAVPSQPVATAKSEPAVAPIKQTEPDKQKEAVQQDSAFVSVKPTEPAKPRMAETPPTLRPAAAASQEPASDEISSLKRNVADLSREVGKLTIALQTVTQLEERVRQLEAMVKLSPDSNGVLKNRIDKISYVLEMLQQKKSDATVFEEFTCSQCRSKGLVAVYAKCTSCGKENWMGWWPDENNE